MKVPEKQEYTPMPQQHSGVSEEEFQELKHIVLEGHQDMQRLKSEMGKAFGRVQEALNEKASLE